MSHTFAVLYQSWNNKTDWKSCQKWLDKALFTNIAGITFKKAHTNGVHRI